MKKILVTIAGVICAAALVVHADDAAPAGKKHGKGDAAKVRKELVEKYDTNKDGKLDKDEIAKMTDEDKAKWDKISGHHKKKGNQ